MKSTLEKVNKLPESTWQWLKINSSSVNVEKFFEGSPIEPLIYAPEGSGVTESLPAEADGQYELNTVGEFVNEAALTCKTVEIDERANLKEPVIIEYFINGGQGSANRLHIAARRGSEAEIIIKAHGQAEGGASLALYITVEVEEEAKLKMVCAQMLSNSDVYIGAVKGEVAGNGRFDLILAEMGGKNAISDCDIKLAGEKSMGFVDSVYIASGAAKRDLNYRLQYVKPETEGTISVKGVLAGSAEKILRSTVDFISGATSSKGREEESVLVLSDKVRNISAPLLLCGEDNVQGEHATNIGRPDGDKVYYLMTRGFTELEARKLLVVASLAPIINKISDDELKHEMNRYIEEVSEYGE